MPDRVERGADRRLRNRGPGRLLPERRDGFDRRALVKSVPGNQGVIRPGVGEARPPRERRQYLDAGLE
jgi:hypothetical protein